MAARIREETGIEPELIAGAGGIFDIHAGGAEIYAKSKTGVFPDDEEVVRKIKKAIG
ncbi:MAG: Rdx family protein [Candidatus Eisenbacteria bacterium]|nr:Rdx family protein [Candidatus Eisenbacteria bacterium]